MLRKRVDKEREGRVRKREIETERGVFLNKNKQMGEIKKNMSIFYFNYVSKLKGKAIPCGSSGVEKIRLNKNHQI